MKKNSGFTLSELLIATGILLLIGVMLVGMLRSGLNVWNRGEARRDVYERGQVILDMLARDLAAAWVERDPLPSKARVAKWDRETPPWNVPGLVCDRDALGRQRIVLTKRGRLDRGSGGEVESDAQGAVKTPSPEEGAASSGGAVAAGAALEQSGQLLQVVYVLDPEPGQFRLWRGTTLFGSASLSPEDLADPTFVRNAFALVSTGVLDVEYRFWGPETRTWNAPTGTQGGPASRWDSSRAWDERAPGYLGDRSRVDCPDILPSKVMISITLLPEADRGQGTTLSADIDGSARKIVVDSTRGFPDAPGAALIEGEWFTYSEKDDTTFAVDERGARGTRAESHAKGVRVVAGETLSTVVYLPCRKEPRRDEERR